MSRLLLEGLCVVAMGQSVAGPASELILADMGAGLVRIESPESGGSSRPGNQHNGSFLFLNRNKRSMVLDLASTEGHQIGMQLIRKADVPIDDPHVMAEGRTLTVQIAKVAGRLAALPYEGHGYEFSVPEQAGEHRRGAPRVRLYRRGRRGPRA